MRLITLDVPEPLLARIEGLAHARSMTVGQFLRLELSDRLRPFEDDDFEVIDHADVSPVTPHS